MKVKALVVDDYLGKRKDGTDFRQLILVDQDDDNRLTETFRFNIQPDDRIAGRETNIRGAVILAAITRINQYESGSLAFGGHLLGIEGSLEFKPASSKPGPMKG